MNSGHLAVGEKILLTLWVGGLWFAGYVIAPILFRMLDRVTAGNVAGQVFTVTAYIGLACGLFLLLGQLLSRTRGFRLWIIVAMLGIIVIGQFLLTPMMQELKQAGITAGTENAAAFARLHGISSILYLINSILGLLLVAVGIRPPQPALS